MNREPLKPGPERMYAEYLVVSTKYQVAKWLAVLGWASFILLFLGV